MVRKIIFQALIFFQCAWVGAQTQQFNLMPSWDTLKILENPHKGFYQHFYDNGTWGYGAKEPAMSNFKGMDHLYVRLAWSYFNPVEDQYDWSKIDTLVKNWVSKGYKIAVCFTCKETGSSEATPSSMIGYATPKWVADAGAKGGWFSTWGNNNWEPLWDDAVFLAKHEKFLKAFNARYGNASWLAYIDIGSVGD
ncbi:MAG: beta-galactosidase, partial [Bacteroidetes bacterium]|nr:beta-galactosidase [Bacteroidota bacterium]